MAPMVLLGWSLGLAMLAGCGGEIAPDGPVGRGTEASLESFADRARVDSSLASDVHAEIVAVTLAGSCADAPVSTVDGVVDVLANAILSEDSCRVHVELDVPAHYQLSLPRAQLELAGAEAEGRARWLVRQRYVGQSARTSELAANSKNIDGVSWEVAARPSPLSPSCKSSRVSYELEISARNLGFSALDRVLLPFRYDRGTRIARCGSGAVVPPPSALEGFCGGVPGHACQGGLVCDRGQMRFEEAMTGRCIDPHAAATPAGPRDLCGGPQGTPCSDGLLCSYVDEASSADARVHGACLPSPAKELEACGGAPEVACEQGFACWHSDYTLGEPFGTCRPLVGEKGGDVCAGTPALGCAPGLSCGNGACMRTDGQVGARCGVEGLSCASDLTCFRNGCRDWTGYPAEAERGEKCGPESKLRCVPGLVCDSFARCN